MVGVDRAMERGCDGRARKTGFMSTTTKYRPGRRDKVFQKCFICPCEFKVKSTTKPQQTCSHTCAAFLHKMKAQFGQKATVTVQVIPNA